MITLEWSPNMDCGVDEIDDGHKHLFELAGELRGVLKEKGAVASGEIVDRFILAVQQHFDTEEALLARAEFPGFEAHKAYHRQLYEKALELKAICQSETDANRAEHCYLEVVTFLLDDVVRGDHEFKSYLEFRGFARPRPRPSRKY